ncbi:hypothetical protein DYH09_02540 [bacterium CPR1]|nr:hypothetical protein [bacterium CPR1]
MHLLPTAATTPPERSRGLFSSTRDKLTDLIGGVTDDRIQIDLSGPEYQSIEPRQADQMLGFFTEKLKEQGFPWRLRAAELQEDGQLKMRRKISLHDAIHALEKGQPIFLEPMRKLNMSINADSLTAVAMAGGAMGGAAAEGLKQTATGAKDAKLGASNGIEVKFGAPIAVSNHAELKLVYQMYNPEEKMSETNPVAKAAHQLSSFTTKRMGSSYPWRFYKKADTNLVVRVAKASLKAGVSGALFGGVTGAIVGGLAGGIFGNWQLWEPFAKLGALAAGGWSTLNAARMAAKGDPLNVVEALERITHGQSVVLQETQIHTATVPFFGSINWFSDRDVGSTVDTVQSLDRLYWVLNPDKKVEEKKQEPGPQTKKDVQVIVQPGGTLHMHVGDDIQIGDQLQVGDRVHVERHRHDHSHLEGEVKVEQHTHLQGSNIAVAEEHTHYEGGIKVEQHDHHNATLNHSPVTIEGSRDEHVHLGALPAKK